MSDDLGCLGLRALGGAPGRAPALGKFVTAGATPQPADGITAMDLSDDEIAVARLPNEVAFGIDASSRVEVGSLHDVLL